MGLIRTQKNVCSIIIKHLNVAALCTCGKIVLLSEKHECFQIERNEALCKYFMLRFCCVVIYLPSSSLISEANWRRSDCLNIIL